MPRVKVGVLVVERWILTRLRNWHFFSSGELNAAVAELLADLNERLFKPLQGNRREALARLDRAALHALPAGSAQARA